MTDVSASGAACCVAWVCHLLLHVACPAHRTLVLQAVDTKERALWEKGAAWEPPSISASLQSLPFFADLPEPLFQEIILEVRRCYVRYQILYSRVVLVCMG